ncbi:MAG: twin-arginine translocase subunit TatC [Actinobacteria bacterium]|nr:twin-arginine translocase subunit TatC [Actinomycetota bacterium]
MTTIGDQERMNVVDHLGELRKRLVIAISSIVVGMVVAFIAKDWVFAVLKRPLLNMDGVNADLTTFSPTEPFMTVLRVSIYAGLVLALPIVLWQLWAFIMPALYESEKRSVLPYVLFTTVLFLTGIVFAYFLVLPIGLSFLVGYGGDIFVQQLRAADYISFVTLFLLAFGVVFEVPAIMLMLTAAELVDHVSLRRVRKYAVIGIAVAAMVLTPGGDPLSMLLMMGPLIGLYELGILLSQYASRRRAKKRAKQAAKDA